MTIYYLYKKTHNQTGLKYLGQTTKDPFLYKGSGKYWSKHIKKHGYDVSTEILGQFTNKDDLRSIGLQYSNKWNIVESREWANLRPESGEGVGFINFTPELRMKLRQKALGRTMSEEAKKKMSVAKLGIKLGPKSKETKSKISASHNPNSHPIGPRGPYNTIAWNKGMKLGPLSEETKAKMRGPRGPRKITSSPS